MNRFAIAILYFASLGHSAYIRPPRAVFCVQRDWYGRCIRFRAAQVPVDEPVPDVSVEPFDPHPQYQFGYSVSDPITGDHKRHHETRDGDVVQGEYSLVEPDGTIRTVTYTADAVNGFNALVTRQPPPAVTAVPAAGPVALAQPIVHNTIAAKPVLTASPVGIDVAGAHIGGPGRVASYGDVYGTSLEVPT